MTTSFADEPDLMQEIHFYMVYGVATGGQKGYLTTGYRLSKNPAKARVYNTAGHAKAAITQRLESGAVIEYAACCGSIVWESQ